jgi:hypothetical protein
MFDYCPQSPFHRFEQSFLIGTPDELLNSTLIALDCVRISTLDYAITTLLPGVQQLLYSPIPDISDSMFSFLPQFASTLQHRFPDQFSPLFNTFLFPAICESLKFTSDTTDTLSLIFPAIPISDFLTFHVPQLILLLSDPDSLRPLSRILLTLDSLQPDLWFDSLYKILSAISESSIQIDFPALAARFLPNLHEREHQLRIFTLISTLNIKASSVIRTAIADCLPYISSSLTETDRQRLIPLIVKSFFNRRDKLTIIPALGPVTASLGIHADREIVTQYCSALSSNLAFHAAYSFSAVAIGLGKARWCELSESFENVSQSGDSKTRRTLSFALASFAFLIPPGDLQGIAKRFLADEAFVSEGVMTNLDQIAVRVREPEELMFALGNPRKYEKWRARLSLSRQLRYCAAFCERTMLIESAKELILDDVGAVRVDAAMSFAEIADDSSVEMLGVMANDDSHFVRQTVGRICRNLSIERKLMCLPVIVKLANDRIPNVRLHAAMAVMEAVRDCPENLELKRLAEGLKMDHDLDVRRATM